MAKFSIVAGATSQSINIFCQDSSSTTGAGLSGLVFNTSSLIAYYTFTGANAGSVQIALATLAAVNSAFSSGGFKEIDATNMKGLYRLDIPNAALATSKGRGVTIQLGGATNLAPVVLEIELTGIDNQDGVRAGMTALPNAAANAAGGLPVSTAGGLDLDEMNVDIEAIQTSTAGLTFTGAGKVDASVRDWVGDTIPARNVTGVPKVDVVDWLGTAVTAATAGIPDTNVKNMNNISASAITTIKAVQGLTTADTIATYTGNTPQTGDAYARLGAPAGASVSADVAAVKSDTAAIKTSTNTGVAPGAASGIAIVGSNMGTVSSVTGAVASVTAGCTLTSGERNSVADALLDRSAGVETSFTPRQSLRLILSSVVAKLSGAATTTVTIRDINDTKARITATVDADGNRTAVTTDVT